MNLKSPSVHIGMVVGAAFAAFAQTDSLQVFLNKTIIFYLVFLYLTYIYFCFLNHLETVVRRATDADFRKQHDEQLQSQYGAEQAFWQRAKKIAPYAAVIVIVLFLMVVAGVSKWLEHH